MLRRIARVSVLATALIGAGCIADQTIESTSWEATLDTTPSVECVKRAINATAGISLADYKHENRSQFFSKPEPWDHYYINVTAIHVHGMASEMGLHIGPTQRQHVSFSLNYGYWPKWEAVTDRVAQALIASISSRCDVPELNERVKKKHNTEWHPKLIPNVV